jgi:uncharacterized RDD family membrane protein YckC
MSPSQTSFCTACGRRQEIQAAAFAGAMYANSPSTVGIAAEAPVYVAPAPTPYAEFFSRFLAFLIDEGIAGLLAACTYFLMAFIGGLLAVGGLAAGSGYGRHAAVGLGAGFGTGLLFWFGGFLLAMAVYILYFVKQETGPRQATIGKSLMGIRVTNIAGETLSVGQSLGRLLIKSTFSWLLFLAGFFMAAFTERKQALHDFAASTVVLKQ